MSAVPSTLNEKFSNAFFKEFTPNHPSVDPVFSRVNAISLHSLTTGILILSLDEPEETRYRQIPSQKLGELRSAVQQSNPEKIYSVMEQIHQEIRTNPENYILAHFNIALPPIELATRSTISLLSSTQSH